MNVKNFTQDENNKSYFKKYCKKSIDVMENIIKEIFAGIKKLRILL